MSATEAQADTTPPARWPAQLQAPIHPLESHERAFWQSRAMLRDPPALTDLPALARVIRGTYPTANGTLHTIPHHHQESPCTSTP